jgi:deoxyribose-phosphate aldolase
MVEWDFQGSLHPYLVLRTTTLRDNYTRRTAMIPKNLLEVPLTFVTLVKSLSHLLVSPGLTLDMIGQACADAVQQGIAAVCVPAYGVRDAAHLLRGSEIAVCGVVGAPIGHSSLVAKRADVIVIIENGASEVDLCMNHLALKSSRYGDVEAEITAVRKLTIGLRLKVTLNCSHLSDIEKVRACSIAASLGADCVRALVNPAQMNREVHLMGQILREKHVGLEVSGLSGFRQLLDAMHCGASSFCVENPTSIIKDFYRWEAG